MTEKTEEEEKRFIERQLKEAEILKAELGKREFNRQVEIVQNFYSTRAVAHASFFVASIFGMFTILALMVSIFQKLSNDWFWTAMVLLSLTYWGIFLVGFHSFLKFSQYSTYAQHAARLTSGKADDFILQSVLEQDKILKKYTVRAGFMKWVKTTKLAKAMKHIKTVRRVNNLKPKEWFSREFSRHKIGIYEWAYFGVSISAFGAFLIIIFLRNHILLV